MNYILRRNSEHARGRMMKASRDAWYNCDYQKAIDILERASATFPTDPLLLLDLGRCYGERYDYDTAGKYFEKAIRITGWKQEALLASGVHAMAFGKWGIAENYFKRALNQKNDSTEVLVELAELYDKSHRREDALACVERALKKDPSCPRAILQKARLTRQAGRLEDAEKLARQVLQKPPADEWPHACVWYELGNILDNKGCYDEAMDAFVQAKKTLRPTAAKVSATANRIYSDIAEMTRAISTNGLKIDDASSEKSDPRRNIAVLCGFPRSGTTLLEQVLDAHPEIIATDETRVFNDSIIPQVSKNGLPTAITILDQAKRDQLRRDYFQFTKQLLGRPIENHFLVDKNPALTPMIPAIVRVFPEMKFIIALRDPRDVCVSCFTQPLLITPFSASFLTMEDTVRQYARVMNLWRAMKPSLENKFVEVRYEDMVKDLPAVARKTLQFLDIRWDDQVLQYRAKAEKKAIHSPTYADVTKPVFTHAVGRWRNYRKFLEPWLGELESNVKALGYE